MECSANAATAAMVRQPARSVAIRLILSALKKLAWLQQCREPAGQRCRKHFEMDNAFSALEPDGLPSILGVRQCAERACPAAQNIQKVLQFPYHKIENSIRAAMESITLESMLGDFRRQIAKSE